MRYNPIFVVVAKSSEATTASEFHFLDAVQAMDFAELAAFDEAATPTALDLVPAGAGYEVFHTDGHSVTFTVEDR
jgi:hypothetical protein